MSGWEMGGWEMGGWGHGDSRQQPAVGCPQRTASPRQHAVRRHLHLLKHWQPVGGWRTRSQ